LVLLSYLYIGQIILAWPETTDQLSHQLYAWKTMPYNNFYINYCAYYGTPHNLIQGNELTNINSFYMLYIN